MSLRSAKGARNRTSSVCLAIALATPSHAAIADPIEAGAPRSAERAEPSLEANLDGIYRGWPEWRTDLGRLEARISELSAQRSEPIDDGSVLARVLEARDLVRKQAARVQGYPSVRLALRSDDSAAQDAMREFERVASGWPGASSWIAAWVRDVDEAELEEVASEMMRRVRELFVTVSRTDAPEVSIVLGTRETVALDPASARRGGARFPERARRLTLRRGRSGGGGPERSAERTRSGRSG